ncbi:MAG: membrane protein insertase YidC [gamma proteobacterium symbiont of Bathyaustriella thionipta]|nr:membrane protein insertase YidC [gamma proteobacterium symbiont of Bathyaustriella thionipta]
MDNQRLLLTIALFFIGFLLYQQWQLDYGPKPQVVTQTEINTPSNSTVSPASGSDEIPNIDVPDKKTASVLKPESGKGEMIQVETDLLKLEINTQGGSIEKLWLKDYPVALDKKDEPFELMNNQPPNLFLAQSGLIGEAVKVPSHTNLYMASAKSYRMQDGQDTLEFSLQWQGQDGIKVEKVFRFHRNSYVVDVEHKVVNDSTQNIKLKEYRQFQRTEAAEPGQSKFIHTYLGGVIYTPENHYEKIEFSDMLEANLKRQVSGGWVAMLQHYFLGAWVPPSDQTHVFFTQTLSQNRYVIGIVSSNQVVEPGKQAAFKGLMFAGPKLQDELAEVAPGLDLTVDYGFLTVLAQPIYWAMKFIHSIFGNWGWSIIFLTFLIKLAFYKLSEKSYKSMANMRKLAPRMKALKERFGDDKQRLNQAMMDMYKTEKINPLGGCLPIVVQIPVFISLYWVLLESVELRQAPFIFWIHDLSAQDPYYILPLIMGISMFIQQKLNPAPMDPMQAKVMMALPFIFTVFFAFFPSGLVLYWVVNNILSISQQWVITKRIEEAK